MPDNPPPIARHALPDHAVVELAGRDAAVFAQAQFINDVGALAPGQWQWSGWLTPKGRVVALFALLKFDEQRLWLLLPDVDPQALAAALRRFVFRSKVAVEVRGDRFVAGCFQAPVRASGNVLVEDDTGTVELDMGGDGGTRMLSVSASAAPLDETALARWRLFDLEHGWPRLAEDQREHWTPQQLSLERLRGFSVRKGCYPGQEIVARTHFLGKAKRGLVLLEGDAVMTAGAEVHGDGRALGSLVSTGDADGRHLGLAVLPLEREPAALGVEGVAAVREIPLRDGMAR